MPVSHAETIMLLLQYADRRPCIVQRGFHVHHANDAAAALFGYTREELVGIDARVLAAQDEWPRLTQYNLLRRHPRPGIEQPPTVYSLRILHRKGHTLETMVGVMLVPGEEEPKYIIMFFSGDDLLSPLFAEVSDGIYNMLNANNVSIKHNTQELVSVQSKIEAMTEEMGKGIVCLKESLADISTEMAVLQDWRKQRDAARARSLTVLGLLLSLTLACVGWYLGK